MLNLGLSVGYIALAEAKEKKDIAKQNSSPYFTGSTLFVPLSKHYLRPTKTKC